MKSNFDLKLSKSPEGQRDRSGQPVSSLGPEEGQLSGVGRGASPPAPLPPLTHPQRHTRLSHALAVIL